MPALYFAKDNKLIGESLEFIQAVGLLKGTFTLFFFGAHWVIYKLYRGRIDDRQSEINRLAKDNHDLRDRLLAIVDRQINYKPKKPKNNRRGDR